MRKAAVPSNFVLFQGTVPVRMVQERRKNWRMQVKAGPLIELRVPLHVSEQEISQFLSRYQLWLKRRLESLRRQQEKKVDLTSSSPMIRVFEKTLPLVICQATHPSLVIEQDHAVLYVKKTDPQTVEKTYRNQQRALLQEEVDRLRIQYDPYVLQSKKPLPEIHWREMKSRWGSCMPQKGKITLNTRLIDYPSVCLEAVLVHEYAHLWVPHHQAEFYRLCTTMMPHYQEAMKKLKSS